MPARLSLSVFSFQSQPTWSTPRARQFPGSGSTVAYLKSLWHSVQSLFRQFFDSRSQMTSRPPLVGSRATTDGTAVRRVPLRQPVAGSAAAATAAAAVAADRKETETISPTTPTSVHSTTSSTADYERFKVKTKGEKEGNACKCVCVCVCVCVSMSMCLGRNHTIDRRRASSLMTLPPCVVQVFK